jgi:hypothetical protein
MLNRIVIVTALSLLLTLIAGAGPAEQTWTGEISDSRCRVEHEPISEDDPVLPSPECVKLCLKSGFKYVFVAGEKVYTILNQENPDLAKFAGDAVKLTGELKGVAITVSKIEAAGH